MALRDPVAVYNAASNLEAHLLRDALVDSGVEAFVTEDVSQVGTWAFGLLPEIHKPQVWVERSDVARAALVLEDYERRTAELRDGGEPNEAREALRIVVHCEECHARLTFPLAQEGSVQTCPRCGSFVDVESDEGAPNRPDGDPNPYSSPRAGESSLGSDGSNIVSPSPALFRVVCLANLVCWVAAIAPSYGFGSFSENMAFAREWNYAEAILPHWAIQIWYYATNLATAVGVLGLFCFWRSARYLVAASLVINVLIAPFLGLCVYSPFEDAASSAAGLMLVWLVTVSFWSPLAGQFGPAPRVDD